ncbi:MAG: ChaN family lipoprotein [Waterburya sp.]
MFTQLKTAVNFLPFISLVYVAGIFLAGCFFTPFPNSLMAIAEPVNVTKTETDISKLQQHDVVYLGETHDSPTAHQRQLEIITQLQEKLAGGEPELAIALEMFQRPFQPILDRYLAGTITEEQLRKQTEYDTRWGFDWEFYAPILRFAKEQQIALIALNTPSEITQKVATSGINSLEAQDWRYIPPLKEIKLDNEKYRQKIIEIYQSHAAQGHGNSTDADNFFAAQVLWDETMAEAIASYYQNHPNSQIIVLVGQAHVMDDYAIPDRVNRRINDPNFTQTTVILN